MSIVGHRVVAISLLMALLGCGREAEVPGGDGPGASGLNEQQAPQDKAAKREAVKKAFKARPVPVSTGEVVLGNLEALYTSTATLSAVEEAVVVAKTQGVVETIFVEEGMSVEQGTPLAQLDTRRLELDLARTQTNVDNFQRALDRAEKLFERNMISTDAIDQARYNYEREAAAMALQAHDLSEATIRAPITGVITVRHIKLGYSMQPSSEAFEMKRADVIEAVLNVPEQELLKLKSGQKAWVRIDALEGAKYEGSVLRVAPEINPGTGTFRVTVQMMNRDGLLKPGMFSRVDILYSSRDNATLVSREAVISQREAKSVFVVEAGIASRRVVETGFVQDDFIEVVSGLRAGDQVVIRGHSALKDGSQVRVVL